jgi:Ser/Thr protein kinase RdoA (MazF antagonist)
MLITKIANELPKFVKKYYGFDNPTIFLLKKGIDNDLFLVKNERVKCVLRLGKRKLGDLVEFEVKLLTYLANHQILVPKIIPTTDKKSFVVNADDTVAICFEFIEGAAYEVSNKEKPNLEVVRQAGEALGIFHKFSKLFRFNKKGRRDILTEFYRVLSKENWMRDKIEGGEKFMREIKEYTEWSKSKKWETGAIHNDYGPDNIMVLENRLIAIVDFDWAGMGPLVKDVGLALALWSLPDNLEKHWQDVIDQFLMGYNVFSPLKLEFDNTLIKWINFCCLSAAATFFADFSESDNKIINVSECRRYRKYLYFNNLLSGNADYQ